MDLKNFLLLSVCNIISNYNSLKNYNFFVHCRWIVNHHFPLNLILQASFEHVRDFCYTNKHDRYFKITKFFNVLIDISFLLQITQFHSCNLKRVHRLKSLQNYFLHFIPQNDSVLFSEHSFSCCVQCENFIPKIKFHEQSYNIIKTQKLNK